MEALTDGQGKMLSEHGYIQKTYLMAFCPFRLLVLSKQSLISLLHISYFVTIIADTNKDGYISKGDIMSKSVEFTVNPTPLSV